MRVVLARRQESHLLPLGWGSHTHLVPRYKGSKKSRVMLTAYQVMATIPQQPRAGRELY